MTSLPYCYCVRIVPQLGTALGFTNLDHDIEIEGITYKASSAVDPFAAESTLNLDVDNTEIKALIDSEDLTPARLTSGYFRDARVAISLINFIDLPATFDEGVPLLRGRVGQVRLTDTYFTFELRSLSEILNRPISFKTSPKCQWTFGDSRCKVDLVAQEYQLDIAGITSVDEVNKTMILPTNDIQGVFYLGTVLFLDTGNQGVVLEIVEILGNSSFRWKGELAEPIDLAANIRVTAQCLRTQQACQGFSNYINFGGFPVGGNFVPGLDKIAVIP